MIRLCKRKMICHQVKEELTPRVLLQYYENIEQEAIIVLYKESGKLIGWTNYQRLLGEEEYISFVFFVAEHSFWSEAKKAFSNNNSDGGLLVDRQEKPLAFCYHDENIQIRHQMIYLSCIEKLRNEYPGCLRKIYPKAKQVCLVGVNEYTWRILPLLKEENIEVVTVGREWEWFGVKTSGLEECSTDECGFVFAEGHPFVRDILLNLRCTWFWIQEIKKRVYKEEVGRLQQEGVSVLNVGFPCSARKTEIENWTKNDLLNTMLPLSKQGIEKRYVLERELDFYGEEVYSKLLRGENLNADGWEKVLLWNIKVEKLRGVSYKNRIYLVGPCIMENNYAMPENSVVGALQRLVAKYDYEVVRVVITFDRVDLFKETLRKLPLNQKDILICLDLDSCFYDGDCLNLTELYNLPREETWIHDDCTMHINATGNKAVAEEIFAKYLKEKCEELCSIEEKDNVSIQDGEFVDEKTREVLTRYIDAVRVIMPDDGKKIGGIVMNCNPFTKGHQFLIETAVKEVDFLYIFVVEEERSFFPFEVRMELVKRGTEHLSNVAVVPSGKWVLSYDTLPVYFEKADKQEVQIDAGNDLGIFARYIAPGLGISCRFVGEEPTDLITRQYNNQMAEFLPRYGIDLIEIPRKTSFNEKPISASTVRKLLGEKDWAGVKELVPDTTYQFLKKMYSGRVAVYGAGMWGNRVQAQLKKMGCYPVGWFDKNYKNFDHEMHIEAPEALRNKQYDSIFVAIESREVFAEIKGYLCNSLEIDEAKIIGPITKLGPALIELCQ